MPIGSPLTARSALTARAWNPTYERVLVTGLEVTVCMNICIYIYRPENLPDQRTVLLDLTQDSDDDKLVAATSKVLAFMYFHALEFARVPFSSAAGRVPCFLPSARVSTCSNLRACLSAQLLDAFPVIPVFHGVYASDLPRDSW